jgi:xanthine dehydrogenase accessory factor
MLELARDLLPLLDAGQRVAVVTVTRVARSAPRGVGSAMALAQDGRVIGSISGGCVEGDAVMLASEVLHTGEGRVAAFGFTDEQAHAAGLACGGSVDVVVGLLTPDDALARDALTRVAADRAATVGVALTGPDRGRVVPLGAPDPATPPGSGAATAPTSDPASRPAPDPVIEDLVRTRETRVVDTATGPLLVVSAASTPRLVVLGAGEHAAALCRVGAASGFAVTVCDAWELLVTRERFPDADRLVAALPHEYLASLTDEDVDARTAVCVLTHDERLDVPALRVALGMPVGFVGAMGARSTVARRAQLLRQAGVPERALSQLHSPLGLDLGGSSPEETALSVLAEIVAVRHGGTGRALRDGAGPLHRRDDDAIDLAAVTTTPSCAVPGAAPDTTQEIRSDPAGSGPSRRPADRISCVVHERPALRG